MQEEKRIKIKKNWNGPNKGIQPAKIQKNVDLLEKTVKKIENKYKTFGFYDSKEEDFFEKNRQKSVILELYNGSKIQGILEGIDKFRICVKVDDIDKFYFKHAVLCYYAQ